MQAIDVNQMRNLIAHHGMSMEDLMREPVVQNLLSIYSGSVSGLPSEKTTALESEEEDTPEGTTPSKEQPGEKREEEENFIESDADLFEETVKEKKTTEGREEEGTKKGEEKSENPKFPFMGLGESAGCDAKAWREEVRSLQAQVDRLEKKKDAAVKSAERLKAMLDETTQQLHEASKKPSCIDGLIIVQSVLAAMEGGANVQKRAVRGVYRSMLEIKSAYDHLSKAAMPHHLKTWFECTLGTKAAIILQKIRSVLDTV